MPVANKKIAQQQQAARDISLQRAVSQAAPGSGVRQAQQVGATLAGAAGQQQLAAQQQAGQQAQQLSQAALAEQQRAGAQAVGQQQLATQRQAISTADRLGKLDQNLKNQLFDQQMTFQRDEAGRTMLNDRQLLDYARAKAHSDEQFRNYQQQVEQASQRKIAILEAAHKKLTQEMEQASQGRRQRLDQKTQEELVNMKRHLEKKLEAEQIRRQQKVGMWSMVGTVAGGVIGGVAGGPAGASAGMGIGGGLGGAIGSST